MKDRPDTLTPAAIAAAGAFVSSIRDGCVHRWCGLCTFTGRAEIELPGPYSDESSQFRR